MATFYHWQLLVWNHPEKKKNEIKVSNKKTHLAVFGTCFFRVYLRNHEKVIYIYLHPCLKTFQIKK